MAENAVLMIDPRAAYDKMQKGTPVLDVREYPEWAECYVRGAELIPLGDIKNNPERGRLAPEVLVLCRSGKRATAAAHILADAGVANPLVIEGGILQWQSTGLPTEREENAPMSIERQVRIGAGAFVLLGLLQKRVRFISWLVACGLIFSGITDFCGMGKVLSKMPWNRPRGDEALR